ncbi:MAG TPA: hypothetical protein VEU62_13670 [Bryobacterales bacterium]|nr:hypothetical protein [Bryobacterales bacterium]
MSRFFSALLTLLVCIGVPAASAWAASGARPGEFTCGTEPAGGITDLFRHRQAEQRRAQLAARGLTTEPAGPAYLPDIGNIAIVDDSEGAVVRPNLFDLGGLTLRFTPAGSGAAQYTAATQPLAFDAAAAQAGVVLAGLGDDDSRLVQLPFSFPFYGQSYSSIYINSDGNLTFTQGDSASTPRSLGRAISGPPRLMPFFEDLDPSQTGAAVRYFAAGDRAVMTWDQVPLWVPSGTGSRESFQVTLYPDGRIDFSYSSITSNEAVVGIAPGALLNGSTPADFSRGFSSPSAGAIAEIFSPSTTIDFLQLSKKFYRNHDDAYDYIILFNNLGFTGEDAGGFAAERNVRNRVLGIGGLLRSNPVFDNGSDWGSPARLQSFLNMGPLSNYPLDPGEIIPIFAISKNTTLTVLGQESGHRFLAYPRYLDPLTNQPSLGLLGRQQAHWSFFFNSDASVVEGNRIQDSGAGQSPRFKTIGTVEHYGPLDQYLMGLRSPDEVPASFLVRSPNAAGFIPSSAPQSGVSFDGTRQDITVQMIAGAEGRRVPDSTVSQKRFSYAFILLIQSGTRPSTADLAQIDAIRQGWEQFFDAAVDNRAAASTALVKQLRLSTWPAGGVLRGSPVTATVTVASAPAANLNVTLSADSSVIAVPASVTIAAGRTSTSFLITGNRLGVAKLSASADPSYEISQTFVQVREDATQLHLDTVSGNSQQGSRGLALPQSVVLQVHDDNDVPFAGVTVNFSPSGDGAVSPARVITDANGQVSVSWQLASAGAANTLRASLDVAPSVIAAVTATALDRPIFAAAGVVNAASFTSTGTISPGGLYSIFGTSLASTTQAASGFPLPPTLGSTQVRFGSIPAPLLYVSPLQINLQVPFEIAPGSITNIVVTTAAGDSQAIAVSQADEQPGIFVDPASRLGVIVHNEDGASTSARPARAGDYLQVYGTGFCRFVTPVVPSGLPAPVAPLSSTTCRPQITIGGIPGTVAFSGLTPGFAGLYQLTIQMPSGVAAGRQGVILTVGGQPSNQVFVMTQ